MMTAEMMKATIFPMQKLAVIAMMQLFFLEGKIVPILKTPVWMM